MEQGLRTTVYPELDELGMQEFVRKFNEMMSGAFVQVGARSSSDSSGNGGQATVDPISGATTNQSPTSSDAQKENMTKAIVEANVRTPTEHPDLESKKNAKMLSSLGSALAIAGGIAVSAIGAVTAITGIVKFLEDSSPPLKKVMDLFGQAFNMIWMPVGTMLAVQMMPLLRDVMSTIAEWMARAWEIYDQEGWVGLIHEAVSTAIDVLIQILGAPEIWIVMGSIVWELLTRMSLGNLWSEWIFGKPAAWTDFRNGIDWVSAYLQFLGDFWGTIFEWLKIAFIPIQHVIETVYNNILLPLFNMLKNIWETVLSGAIRTIKSNLDTLHNFFHGLTPSNLVSRFVTAMTTMFNTLFANLVKSIGDVISNIIPDAKSLGDGIKNGINSMFGTHFAEGGIATQPTYGLFGEAGPEAVIPLNQFSQIMNEYSSNSVNTIGGNIGGNINNITINIDGSKDPVAVGDEVQRILEKTVGKASSKLMWW